MARASRRSSVSSLFFALAVAASCCVATPLVAAPPPGLRAAPPELPRQLSPPIVEPTICPGAIDGVVDGSVVDLGRRGFDLRSLPPDFARESLDVRAEGPCDAQGVGVDAELAVASSWRRDADGLRAWVGQRVSDEPTAWILEPSWAQLSVDGYVFQVYAWEGWYPTGGGSLSPPSAESPAVPPKPAVPRGPDVPFRAGPPAPPAKTLDVDTLEELVAALAPGIDLDCFHRRVQGGWDDLGPLGIGDPRPALPAGFTESSFGLSYLEPPAAGCAGPSPPLGDGVVFYAQHATPAGASAYVSVYSLPTDGSSYPGYVDDWSASWSNDRYQLTVWTWRADGTGDPELVAALARALDPGFDLACLVRNRQLTPDEAVALGFHVAQPPAGYTLGWSQLWSQSASPACTEPPPSFYSFYWSFTSDTATIDAGLYRHGDLPTPDAKSAYLAWTDAAGTNYWVSGYTWDGTDGPPLETLEDVARSMDPTYDSP